MADHTTSSRSTWLAIAIVVVGVVLVTTWSSRGLASDGGDRQQVISMLGSAHRSGGTRPFDGADVMTVMGSSSLDLRNVQLRTPEAVVDVFAMMGSVTIRVPDGWTIDTRAVPVLGGIRDLRWRAKASDTASDNPATLPRLVLRGFVMMGSILIK